MPFRRSVKCLDLFFIVFLAYQEHIQSTNPIGKQQEYYHAVRKTANEFNDIDSKIKPADWYDGDDVFSRPEDERLLSADEELGFDLTDEEMKKFKLWPKGIIPYYIDTLSFNDKVLRDRIRVFLHVMNRGTKLNFVELPSPPTDDKTRWVFFVNRRGQLGCADHSILNFTNEGVQQVILGYDCLATAGELGEAVLAIAGVPAEHNHPDRDDYIQIMYENIVPEKKYLFQKLQNNEFLFFDVPYSYDSVGHFHHHKHSVNGRATIELLVKDRPYLKINRRMIYTDIKKIRMLYNFIVKSKEDRRSECDKLFRKGRNFRAASMVGELKSRPKPNRYLGISDTVNDKAINVDADNTDTEHKYVDGEGKDSAKEFDEADIFAIHPFRSKHNKFK